MAWTAKSLCPEAQRGLTDLYFFLKEFWGLDLEEQPHREVCDVIEKAETDEATPYAMICVPRATYKTSIGRGVVVWKQLRQIYLNKNYYHRVMLASATLALGETSLRAIEGRLRHKDFISAYGRMWINDRQNNLSSRHPDGMVLGPRLVAGEIASVAEPSFWVGSERRISTGFHADEAFVDDLNNRDNTQTDHRRMAVQAYWELIFPILQRKDRTGKPSKILMNCTPWHDDDVGSRIRRQEKERLEVDPEYQSRWLVLKHSAYLEDGSAWAPGILSLESLEELRETLSTTLFSANYLVDPVGRNGFVDEDQIIFMPRSRMPTPLRWLRATVDPSQHNAAREIGCYTAIMVGGYDRFANLYFLDARGSREWDSADVINELFQLNKDYPDIPILIEDSHMTHFDHALRLEEENRSKDGIRRHLRVQWIPIDYKAAKYQRWERLQPRFRSRRIFFADEIESKLKAEIKEELVRGQAARFKDFLDAIAMAEMGVTPKVARDGVMVDQSKEMSEIAPNKHQPTFAQAVPGIERLFQP